MDYQGNTRKEREQKALEAESKERPEKKVEKVVTGEVVQKPKSIGRKFKDIFFSGSASQAAKHVTGDVLYPALRNLIFDMVTEGVRRLVFPDGSRRFPAPYRQQRTDYNSRYYVNNPLNQGYQGPPRPMDPRTRANLPDQPRIRQNRHEISDIILGTREEAELVLERLNDILDNYDVVALADLYVLLGLETSHIDSKWGWTYLNNAQIRQIRQGYLLELPLLEEI